METVKMSRLRSCLVVEEVFNNGAFSPAADIHVQGIRKDDEKTYEGFLPSQLVSSLESEALQDFSPSRHDTNTG